jgi:ribosomal protein S18 acetylase RimI-like enzyme
MRYTIRAAISATDWQQGLAVLHRVYVGEGHSPADRAAQMQRREVLEPEGSFLVAVREADDAVLGATILLHPGSTFHQVARPGEREFRMLAVHPDARGQGVGEALVRACIHAATAEKAEALVLWTRPTMIAAQRLYDRLGFVRVPERDKEDARGFTRLVYRLSLQ